MRIEELNDVPLRVVYDDQGRIADIIDNSISAGASVVKVDFEWAGQKSWVTITDDGFLPGFGVVEGAVEADWLSGSIRIPIWSPKAPGK